jgi:predicted TIM-barrel fold metal-dependent hydrolase
MHPIQQQEPLQFNVPTGACDCHTHVFGPADVYPYWVDRTYTPADASVAQLKQLHRSLGIDRVVVVHPSPYGSDNTRTLDALRELGPQSRGVAVLDEDTISQEQIADLHDAGFRGARLNLETVGITEPSIASNKLSKTAQLIEPFGWHIQIFSNLDLITALKHDLEGCKVPIVLDHFARIPIDAGIHQPKITELFEMMQSGNLWMKLSAPQRASSDPESSLMAELVHQLVSICPEHLVWGSDWPHSGAHYGRKRVKEEIEPFHAIDDGHALNRLFRWLGDAQLMQKILSDNPARLYDFPSTK